MYNNEDFFLNSKIYKYFDKNLLKNKDIRDTLVSFEELLFIKKNIISMYNTDDPFKIKKFIGKELNGIIISKKDFDYVLLISNTYNKIYIKCKELLNEKRS